ncbi:hypothetical protein CYY_008322 [Polysphondylium violaceum]|uniref:Uncharacterized protein n=1 Tax=Polysphondylium violaceum TaxID=133409 RepID=A0A8J4UQ90_9MYCE|nr:hypothetical protein CYY_008322 [Polysphondylium violaceum]
MSRFKERNNFYIRCAKQYVVPLLLILHDYKQFTEIQFQELVLVLQGILQQHLTSLKGNYHSTILTVEQSSSSKPCSLSDFSFTFKFTPTYPKYSIFINKLRNSSTKATTTATNTNPTSKKRKNDIDDDTFEEIKTKFDNDDHEAPIDVDINDPIDVDDQKKDNKKQKEQEKEDEEEEDYKGGVYDGLTVTGHTLVIETFPKANNSIAPNDLFAEEFVSPNKKSKKTTTTTTTTTSSSSTSSTTSTSPSTGPKTNRKSKSSISETNSNNLISTYFCK